MPQAKRGGSRSGSGTSRSGTAGRSAASSSSSRKGTQTSSGAKPKTGTQSAPSAADAAASDARLEAVAQRIRKLNERIIDAGKGAGDVTLTSYEKALKSIASTLERGPGSSDVEWISNLATAQAKFIRDVTTAWTSAAREMLK
jgi:hypothetical protein